MAAAISPCSVTARWSSPRPAALPQEGAPAGRLPGANAHRWRCPGRPEDRPPTSCSVPLRNSSFIGMLPFPDPRAEGDFSHDRGPLRPGDAGQAVGLSHGAPVSQYRKATALLLGIAAHPQILLESAPHDTILALNDGRGRSQQRGVEKLPPPPTTTRREA